MRLKIALVTYLAFMFASILNLNAQNALEKINSQLQKVDSLYHRQIVFIHTDKNRYVPGETIWLKIYVRDAQNKPDTLCSQLYAELLSPDNKPVYRYIHKPENGTSIGQIPLSDSIFGGYYTLRAYTNFMRNFPADDIFQKLIYIDNEKSYFYSDDLYSQTKKQLKESKKIKFNIYPEGNIIAGNMQNKIFFEILNYPKNQPVNVGVKIFDNTKRIVCQSDTRKTYGNVSFKAKPDATYKIEFNVGKKTYKFNLPDVENNTFKLSKISENKTEIVLKAISNKLKSDDKFVKQIILIGRAAGNTFYLQQTNLDNNIAEFNIPKAKLPNKNIRFILTDLNGRILSELKYDNRHKNEFDFSYKKRLINDSVFIDIQADKCIFDSCDLSVSVKTDTFGIKKNDVQMSFNYPKKNVFENLEKLHFKVNNTLKVSGRLTKIMFDIPQENTDVSLFVLNDYYKVLKTKTDESGRFSFSGLNYRDTIELHIEAYNKKGNPAYLINIDEPDYPHTPKIYPQDLEAELARLKTGRKQYRKRQNYLQQHNLTDNHSLHQNANRILYFDDIDIAGYTDALSVIANYIPGIERYGESALRGKNSFMNSSEPAYLLDDVMVDKNMIASLPPQQVERVEIVQGANAVVYGANSSNGVVAVYTKQGYNIETGVADFFATGYHTAKPFEANRENPDACLYWNPNLQFDEKGRAEIKFLKSKSNIYVIDIEGFVGNRQVSKQIMVKL